MRRTLTGVMAIALLATMSPAMGTELEAALHGYSVDHLQADWAYPAENGHGARWYIISADVATDLQDGRLVGSEAFAALGRCNSDASHCWAHLVRYQVVRYESDAALQKATLVLRRGSQKHRVHFTATDTSSSVSDGKLDPCQGETKIAHREFARNAYASGVVFGKHVWTRTEIDPSVESLQRSVEICAN